MNYLRAAWQVSIRRACGALQPERSSYHYKGKRAECLNTGWFMSLDDARSKCEAFRRNYNEHRPHSAIGDKCPTELMNGVGPHGPPGA